MDNKKLLGKRIKELRKRKDFSQEKLAELAKIEPTSLSNIENGRNYPSFATLENVLHALDSNFLEVFKFHQHNVLENLLAEINTLLKNNPDKLQDFYKIVRALTD